MTDSPLRARSVSEIVDVAFQLYRRDALQYIVITAIAYTPWLIVQLLISPARRQALPIAHGAVAQFGVLLLVGVGSWVAAALMSAVIIKVGSQNYLNGTSDVAAAVRDVWPRVPAILFAGFIRYLLVLVGAVFFLVGALYVIARYFAVSASIVLEDCGPLEALRRSSELSKGRKRHILNTLLLVWIIYALLSACILFATTAVNSQVLTLVLSSAYQIIAYPIFGLTTMLLYYDCRIRSEGFDIERMAASLGVGPGSEPGIAGAAP